MGARTSYTFFWVASLAAGWCLHQLDPLGSEQRRRDRADEPPSSSPPPLPGGGGHGGDDQKEPWSDGDLADQVQWQRKTMWVGLAFSTMAMPALVCFAGLRRSGRQMYRHSLTDLQKSTCGTTIFPVALGACVLLTILSTCATCGTLQLFSRGSWQGASLLRTYVFSGSCSSSASPSLLWWQDRGTPAYT